MLSAAVDGSANPAGSPSIASGRQQPSWLCIGSAVPDAKPLSLMPNGRSDIGSHCDCDANTKGCSGNAGPAAGPSTAGSSTSRGDALDYYIESTLVNSNRYADGSVAVPPSRRVVVGAEDRDGPALSAPSGFFLLSERRLLIYATLGPDDAERERLADLTSALNQSCLPHFPQEQRQRVVLRTSVRVTTTSPHLYTVRHVSSADLPRPAMTLWRRIHQRAQATWQAPPKGLLSKFIRNVVRLDRSRHGRSAALSFGLSEPTAEDWRDTAGTAAASSDPLNDTATTAPALGGGGVDSLSDDDDDSGGAEPDREREGRAPAAARPAVTTAASSTAGPRSASPIAVPPLSAGATSSSRATAGVDIGVGETAFAVVSLRPRRAAGGAGLLALRDPYDLQSTRKGSAVRWDVHQSRFLVAARTRFADATTDLDLSGGGGGTFSSVGGEWRGLTIELLQPSVPHHAATPPNPSNNNDRSVVAPHSTVVAAAASAASELDIADLLRAAAVTPTGSSTSTAGPLSPASRLTSPGGESPENSRSRQNSSHHDAFFARHILSPLRASHPAAATGSPSFESPLSPDRAEDGRGRRPTAAPSPSAAPTAPSANAPSSVFPLTYPAMREALIELCEAEQRAAVASAAVSVKGVQSGSSIAQSPSVDVVAVLQAQTAAVDASQAALRRRLVLLAELCLAHHTHHATIPSHVWQVTGYDATATAASVTAGGGGVTSQSGTKTVREGGTPQRQRSPRDRSHTAPLTSFAAAFDSSDGDGSGISPPPPQGSTATSRRPRVRARRAVGAGGASAACGDNGGGSDIGAIEKNDGGAGLPLDHRSMLASSGSIKEKDTPPASASPSPVLAKPDGPATVAVVSPQDTLQMISALRLRRRALDRLLAEQEEAASATPANKNGHPSKKKGRSHDPLASSPHQTDTSTGAGADAATGAHIRAEQDAIETFLATITKGSHGSQEDASEPQGESGRRKGTAAKDAPPTGVSRFADLCPVVMAVTFFISSTLLLVLHLSGAGPVTAVL